MIGIVVVSHSHSLGTAAVELASEMVPHQVRPALRVAAGLDEHTLGTDAAAIAQAITEVDSPDGVLILVDLGSAILSAEMAKEFIDPDLGERTIISSAPLVEGLITALVTASTGASLEEVAGEASMALLAKQEQLGDTAGGPPDEPADLTPWSGEPADLTPWSGDADKPADLTPWSGDGAGSGGRPPGITDLPPEVVFTWTIRNAHGLHARPAATLVAGLRWLDTQIAIYNRTTGKGPGSPKSLTAIQTLGLRRSDLMEVRISGPDADQAMQRLTELAHTDFGEVTQAPVAPAPAQPTDPTRTGRQIVLGRVRHIAINPDTSSYSSGDPATEIDRLAWATAQVTDTLRTLEAATGLGIYAVQELMLDDDATGEDLRALIRGGLSAAHAVDAQFTRAAGQFDALDDPYLRARGEDQRGLKRMLLRALMGQEISVLGACGILVLDELDPLTAGSLDPHICEGIITTSGGATGHGAILAQSRGFALVTGQDQATTITEGTMVGIDPVENRLWINPSAEEVEKLRTLQLDRQAETEQAIRDSRMPALTKAGQQILVEANISSVRQAIDAATMGADGSGLVRTEVLFGQWDHAPSAAEQGEVYTQIGRAFDGRMITIRTWDPGGDKPLAFLDQTPEANPMLGERGIRAMKRLPDLLDEQLAGILLASQQTAVRVLLPMITASEEVAWARARLASLRVSTTQVEDDPASLRSKTDRVGDDPRPTDRVGDDPHTPAALRLGEGPIQVGIMVETPAAALRAKDFLDVADFISIGTNDLTQYTLAVDRGNPRVADIAQGELEAVWDLIAIAAQAFAGRPIGVCGDLASNPDAVSRLIDLGVTELSVRPPLVAIIKQAVRRA